MLRHPPLFVPVFLTLCATATAQLVSPPDRATLEGSSFTHFPLGRASARMQTLHANVPGGTIITGHAYRRDAAGVRGQVDAFSCDFEVTLSVSPNQPTQASATFATNTGSNPVVVLPRTVLNFPATHRPNLDPSPNFDLVVPYATPFVMPPQGGTLCVDVRVFGNSSAAGTNLNLSIYLDAHENFADGRAEQAGFRTFQGCPAPGSTANSYATMTYWRLPTAGKLDVSIRDGVPDDGSGLARAFVTIGHGLDGSPWPLRPDCAFWSTAEVWFVLPGAMTGTGSLDSSLTGLPLLPPGYRLWAQAGSVHLGNVAMAFSDATTFVTPPAGPLPIPTARIVHSTNGGSATGTVSYAVPVMAFL